MSEDIDDLLRKFPTLDAEQRAIVERCAKRLAELSRDVLFADEAGRASIINEAKVIKATLLTLGEEQAATVGTAISDFIFAAVTGLIGRVLR